MSLPRLCICMGGGELGYGRGDGVEPGFIATGKGRLDISSMDKDCNGKLPVSNSQRVSTSWLLQMDSQS